MEESKRYPRYLFVMQGGLNPSKVYGPVRDASSERKMIKRLLVRYPNALRADGWDTVYWLQPKGIRPPFVLGNYSGGYMDDLRCEVRAWLIG